MVKVPAIIRGSFAPTLRFGKLEIHKVCLRFPNLDLWQNLSLLILGTLIIGRFWLLFIFYIVQTNDFVL